VAPWWLLLALLAIPIIIAFARRPAPRTVVVASLLLVRSLGTAMAKRRRTPREDLLALALILAALLALIIGLSAGSDPQPRPLVVVLDNSASMDAQTGGVTRFERALKRLDVELERRPGAPVTLVATSPVRIVSEPSLGREAMARSAAALVREGLDGDLGPLLVHLCAAEPPPELLWLGDTSFEGTLDCVQSRPELGPPMFNRGISALRLRPVDGLGLVEAWVKVDATEPGEVQVLLSAGDTELGRVHLSLRPAAEARFRLRLRPGTEIQARLIGGDDWAADDTAMATVPPLRRVQVHLMTETNTGFMAAALGAHPNVELVIGGPSDVPRNGLDLLMVEVEPNIPLDYPTRTVILGGASTGEARLESKDIQWREADPLLRHVDMGGLFFDRLTDVPVSPGAQVLGWTPTGAIMVRDADGAGNERLVTGFGLNDTDLGLRVGMANWVANIVEWSQPLPSELGGSPAGVLSAAQSTAQPPAEQLAVALPAGNRPAPVAIGLAALLLCMELLIPVTGGRSGLGYGLRAVVLLVLLVAWTDPAVEWNDNETVVVHLVDRSASVGTAALDIALSQVQEVWTSESGLVSFGDGAEVHRGPGGGGLRDIELDATGTRSDLAAGLFAAMGLIPDGANGTVEVVSDGRWETAPTEALAQLSGRGLAINFHPMPENLALPAMGQLSLSSAVVAPGASLAGRVWVNGGSAGREGAISVSIGEATSVDLPFDLASGVTESVAFELALPADLTPAGAHVQATFEGQSLGASFALSQSPRVWVVGDSPRDSEPLMALLQAEQFDVQRVGVADAAPPLDDVDLIVLVDTPTRAVGGRRGLSAAFVAALDPFVQAGGSLVSLGGEHAYELGAWHQSDLAPLLPVRIDPDGARKDDAVSLVIVLDKSGSMARAAGTLEGAAMMGSVGARFRGGRPEGSKIRLASEGAIAALERLREVDQIGVLAVDSEPRWIVPLSQATGRSAKARRVSSIAAGGGGMFVVTGLQAARAAIRAADTPLRHIILFADTGDAGEKEAATPPEGGAPETALGIARGLVNDRITLSVIGIGAENARDTSFLKELARAGGGRFHRTQDPDALPALFSKETEDLIGTGLQEGAPVKVRVERWHPMLEGISFENAPALLGHNITHRRPQSRVLLAAEDGAPILAVWRYGLGEVVSFTADAAPHWAANWLKWPGFARLWTQMARQLVTQAQRTGVSVEVNPTGSDWEIVVQHRDLDGASLAIPGLRVDAVGTVRTPISMSLVEPGRWVGRLRASPGTVFEVEVRDRSGQQVGSVHVASPTSGEAIHLGLDEDAMTGLVMRAKAKSSRPRTAPIQPWLLLLAALLLVADSFARRRVA
jgi:Ca-activated chloride channel family protein